MSAGKVGFDPTTVECCSTVDLSAEDAQERCRARPETCLGCCIVASVEEGHDVERVAETTRVNDKRVVVTHTPRRRCVLHFVSLDQAGERLMMRCHQYCGGAADSVH